MELNVSGAICSGAPCKNCSIARCIAVPASDAVLPLSFHSLIISSSVFPKYFEAAHLVGFLRILVRIALGLKCPKNS